jgi:hypothetical protein
MKCPSSPDRRHYRDNQELCHYCGIPFLEGMEGAPVLTSKKAPLPLFFVTEKLLPKKRLAQLDEKARPNVIQLSLPRLLTVGEDERRYVIFHELGHWFRHAYVPSELAGNEEGFAHAFGLYFTKKVALKSESPPMWALIDVLSKPHQKRIRRHAEKMLKALS